MPKGKQFNEDERGRLKELVLAKKDVIECKKSDTVSIKHKKVAWEEITEQFNALCPETPRTCEQLRRLWDNIKFRRKAELAADKRSVLKTGGGPPPKCSDPDPDLDCLGVDIELRDSIDSDTAALPSPSNEYILCGDVLVQAATVTDNEAREHGSEEEVEEGSDHDMVGDPGKKSSDKTSKKKRKGDEFTKEATLRIDRAKYLFDMDQKIGELRMKEAEINLEIAKRKLELAEMEISYKKKKFELLIRNED